MITAVKDKLLNNAVDNVETIERDILNEGYNVFVTPFGYFLEFKLHVLENHWQKCGKPSAKKYLNTVFSRFYVQQDCTRLERIKEYHTSLGR